MATDGENSVTRWVNDLKAGDQGEPARLLWQRYFERLARLAQARMRATSRGASDGEDVALSVFDSFFQGVAAGRFPDLGSRDELWRLLVTIAARKAHNQQRDEGRLKRGGGRVLGEGALAAHSQNSDENFMAQVVGREPTPELAAMVSDEYRRLFARLTDESARMVALLKLEGHSNEEIAQRLDCSLRTVERKLNVIRMRWMAEEAP